MEFIVVHAEGYADQQYSPGPGVTAGAILNQVRGGHGLRFGFLRRGTETFVDQSLLTAGEYLFSGFSHLITSHS